MNATEAGADYNVKQRMPAILAVEDIEAWLSGAPDDAQAALKPYSADSVVELVEASLRELTRATMPSALRQLIADCDVAG